MKFPERTCTMRTGREIIRGRLVLVRSAVAPVQLRESEIPIATPRNVRMDAIIIKITILRTLRFPALIPFPVSHFDKNMPGVCSADGSINKMRIRLAEWQEAIRSIVENKNSGKRKNESEKRRFFPTRRLHCILFFFLFFYIAILGQCAHFTSLLLMHAVYRARISPTKKKVDSNLFRSESARVSEFAAFPRHEFHAV